MDNKREVAARGVEALNSIVNENEVLLEAHDRLKVENSMLHQKCQQLEARNATLATERDHYMKFSTELVSRLEGIRMLIGHAIDESTDAAYRPPAVPPPPLTPLPEIDALAIQGLIRKLPMNGGSKEQI